MAFYNRSTIAYFHVPAFTGYKKSHMAAMQQCATEVWWTYTVVNEPINVCITVGTTRFGNASGFATFDDGLFTTHAACNHSICKAIYVASVISRLQYTTSMCFISREYLSKWFSVVYHFCAWWHYSSRWFHDTEPSAYHLSFFDKGKLRFLLSSPRPVMWNDLCFPIAFTNSDVPAGDRQSQPRKKVFCCFGATASPVKTKPAWLWYIMKVVVEILKTQRMCSD